MKKLIAIAILSIVCLSFAACGSSDESSDTESSKIESSVAEDSKTESSKSKDANPEGSKNESGQEVDPEDINTDWSMDELVDYIDANKEVSDEYESSIYAEGSTLIYDYTFKPGVSDETIENYISMMKLDWAKANFESIKERFQCVDSIKFIYRSSDGDILAEETY